MTQSTPHAPMGPGEPPPPTRVGWARHALCAVVAGFAVLAGMVTVPAKASASTPSLVFATLPDGIPIALHLVFPAGFTTADGRRWPALFNMDGYGGAGTHNDDEFDIAPTRSFVLVYASIRGTGCSGGTFTLFSRQSALDGKWIIDHWIPAQKWSDGRVGIFGHSLRRPPTNEALERLASDSNGLKNCEDLQAASGSPVGSASAPATKHGEAGARLVLAVHSEGSEERIAEVQAYRRRTPEQWRREWQERWS